MNISNAVSALHRPGAVPHPHAQSVVAFGEALVDQFRDRNCAGRRAVQRGMPSWRAGRASGADDAGRQGCAGRAVATGNERTGWTGVTCSAIRRAPTGQVKVTETAAGQVFDILFDQAYDHIHTGLARMVGLRVHPQNGLLGHPGAAPAKPLWPAFNEACDQQKQRLYSLNLLSWFFETCFAWRTWRIQSERLGWVRSVCLSPSGRLCG